MNIGFIGLGTMGAPMAGHLLRAGNAVHVWSRRATGAEGKDSDGFCSTTSVFETGVAFVRAMGF